jgi:hypothetical protein
MNDVSGSGKFIYHLCPYMGSFGGDQYIMDDTFMLIQLAVKAKYRYIALYRGRKENPITLRRRLRSTYRRPSSYSCFHFLSFFIFFS